MIAMDRFLPLSSDSTISVYNDTPLGKAKSELFSPIAGEPEVCRHECKGNHRFIAAEWTFANETNCLPTWFTIGLICFVENLAVL